MQFEGNEQIFDHSLDSLVLLVPREGMLLFVELLNELMHINLGKFPPIVHDCEMGLVICK